MANESAVACVVCGEAAAAEASSECNWCGGRYHLNQRNDVEASDCGRVWIDEQFLALQFGCDNCLRDAGQETASRGAAERRHAPAPRRRYRRRE